MAHDALFYGESAAYRETLADLIVGKNSSQGRTPIDLGIRQIGDTIRHKALLLLLLRQVLPVGVISLKTLNEFGDGLCLLKGGVVVGMEHLYERPLSPMVELGIAGANHTAPVVRETDLLQLLDVAGDVRIGGLLGVLTCLNGILLGGQTIGVKTHGMQYVEALQTFVTRVYIAGNIA